MSESPQPTPQQVTLEQLKQMSPEGIVKAQNDGRLNQLLGRTPAVGSPYNTQTNNRA